MKARSIRTLLFAVTITALFLTALLITSADIIQFYDAYRSALEGQAIALAQNLRETVSRSLQFFPLDGLSGMPEFFRSFLAVNENISYSFITDAYGLVLYHSDVNQTGTVLDPEVYADITLDSPSDKATLAVGPYYEAMIPLFYDGERVGAVHVGFERALVDAQIRRMIVQSAVILLGVLLVAGIPLSMLLTRFFAAPLARLTEAALEIAEGDLERTVIIERQDELGALAQAFNTMASQVRELVSSLEQHVEERTQDLAHRSAQLQLAADVSHSVTSILDVERLTQQVVTLIQERFDLYYVGLFLVDPAEQWLVLQASAGAGGGQLLERGYRLRFGEGLVGWSIINARARVASDALNNSVRVHTAELSDTRSEVALPLRSRGQILGALSVQSDVIHAFDESFVSVLQTIADSVAVALDNARLLAESQEALETARRAYGELSGQAWRELLEAHRDWGYSYENQSINPVGGDWSSEMVRAQQLGERVVEGALAIPIRERDQIVGVLSFEKESEESWRDEEVVLLETLTERLSAALESARAYQQTQQRAALDRLTSEVTARIRETLDIDIILQTAVAEIRESLELHDIMIRFEEPE